MTDLHDANGCRFIAADDMIVRWLRRKPSRKFEPVTTEWMFDVMTSREGAYVDVGASTGWFVVPMAKAGHAVVAFEPNPNAFERLTQNCALNGAEADLRHAAVSDTEGKATLFANGLLPLTSGGSLNKEDCICPTTQFDVDAVTIDAAVTKPVALMKIDVEGHELPALRGAQDVIKNDRPHLVLEANTAQHKAALAAWLDVNGYTYADADERNMLCSPAS